uniref:Macaca fascicularis brain cDNA clone: QtrA-19025, similar to human jumonji domain containing 2A (JMJD2A), mRNA, RefSeq: NM_014663.1 n=1 Tax=Macaca fascicularis TaxID=9541 RepID=I7GJJ1_MACFA|nr:unnamed protein product [Macaca fascicularis]
MVTMPALTMALTVRSLPILLPVGGLSMASKLCCAPVERTW